MNRTIKLADINECTACGACMAACPTGSVAMKADKMDCLYPQIDAQSCISCGKCERVCPAKSDGMLYGVPDRVYVAWNNDQSDRTASASGGLATAIYRYSLENKIKTFGVTYTPGQTAPYIEIKSGRDIEACRNSKYVFSDITPVLPDIKKYLSDGERVIVIALPCQAAAVLSYVGERHPNLTVIDIVCHGVCPGEYLNQHVKHLEKKKHSQTTAVFFRDPEYGTENFTFSLYNGESLFYKRKVYMDDVYQIGYHKCLTYRENCYSCKYAAPHRVGDMTLSDFSGLGRCAPYDEERRSVSCVMVSSEKGTVLLDTLVDKGMIQVRERPADEALKYEKQLRAPSEPHVKRSVFVEEYEKERDFEKAARTALRKNIRNNMIRHYLRVDQLKAIASKCLPKRMKEVIKKLVKKDNEQQ